MRSSKSTVEYNTAFICRKDKNGLLTARECEVLVLTAEGASCTQIAERLSISYRTVETHRYNLMQKLGLHNRSDLVRYAINLGIADNHH
jgi:DNA-binding CsgD family transcriptional regulator